MMNTIKFMGQEVYDEIISTYHQSTRMLLERDVEGIKSKHPEIDRNLHSCMYNADRRSVYEYGRNVAKAWVMEDFWIRLYNIWTPWHMANGGSDSDRVISSKKGVTNEADMVLNYNGERVNIEFVADYHGNYKRTNSFFLRDYKLKNLRRSAKRNRTLILFADIRSRKFMLIDVNNIKFRPTKRWGKPATEVFISQPMAYITQPNLIKYTELVMGW